jgi:hypothetical protein
VRNKLLCTLVLLLPQCWDVARFEKLIAVLLLLGLEDQCRRSEDQCMCLWYVGGSSLMCVRVYPTYILPFFCRKLQACGTGCSLMLTCGRVGPGVFLWATCCTIRAWSRS